MSFLAVAALALAGLVLSIPSNRNSLRALLSGLPASSLWSEVFIPSCRSRVLALLAGLVLAVFLKWPWRAPG
jgi:hypothetical protein